MRTQRPKIHALLILVAVAFVPFFSGWWLVHPAYAATEYQVVCPANGIGSVEMLRAAILEADKTPELDSVVINVTGADCVFTLVKKDPNTTRMGLPIIHYDLLIRAVGGRAIIERSPSAPEFSILRTVEDLTLENITLRNGIAKESQPGVSAAGGAIDGRALTLTNVLLANNESDHGGAIHVTGPLVMNHVTATGNRTRGGVQGSGGAIVVYGPLTATNITVTHNVGAYKGFGGGIYVYGNANISSALFAHNRTDEAAGGGLYVYGDATFSKTDLMSNTAGTEGGGLSVIGNLTVSSSNFANNSAQGNGGGLYTSGGLSVTSSLFFSNSSAANGGGVYVGGPSYVSETHFLRNIATNAGGGLAEGGEVMVSALPKMTHIEASIFISNQAAYGGGAQIQSGVVQKNLFEQNTGKGASPYYGGGALMVASQATVQNNRFIQNSAPLGGALHLMFYPPSASGSGSQIVNNLMIENEAGQGNGGAIAVGVNLDIFQGNYVEIIHNTLVRKQRSVSSAIYVARSTADINNNIIVLHRIGIHAIGTSILADANLIYETTTNYAGIDGGPQDLIADPLFVDPANADYHLQVGSPAQDSALGLEVATDFDGILRPQGKGYDRGAFEVVHVNHAPVALADTYTTSVDTNLVISAPGVFNNDSDPDGDALSAAIASAPAHGELVFQPTGAFIYTPTAGFTGTDSFSYQATDGGDLSAAVSVTIHVVGEPLAITGLQAIHDGPVVAGRKINFVATVETGSNLHFAWNFGDNGTAEGATASHIYAGAGEYSVTVTASNSLGSEVTAIQVTVLPNTGLQHQIFTPFIVK